MAAKAKEILIEDITWTLYQQNKIVEIDLWTDGVPTYLCPNRLQQFVLRWISVWISSSGSQSKNALKKGVSQRYQMLPSSFKKLTEITPKTPRPISAISDLLCAQRALTFCLYKNNLPVSISDKPISTLNAMNLIAC